MKKQQTNTISPFKITAFQSLNNSHVEYNLSNSKVSTYSRSNNLSHWNYKLLQQLSNDNEFNLIQDQITTYLDQNGHQIDINNLKMEQSKQQLSVGNNSIDKHRKNAFYIQEMSDFKIQTNKNSINNSINVKKNSTFADIERTWQSRLSKQKNKKQIVVNSEINGMQLGNIQSIIDEISLIMTTSTQNNQPMKIALQTNKHSNQHKPHQKKFKDWSIRNNMTSKLDDMLISYKTDADILIKQHQNDLKTKKSSFQEQRISETYSNQHDEQNEFQDLAMMDFSKIDKKQLMDLNNIEINDEDRDPYYVILVIKWNFLPSMPAYSSFLLDLIAKSTTNLAYPNQSSYEAILKYSVQKKIHHYSIFKKQQQGKQIVGVYQQNGQKKLRSEEQYMKFWQQVYNGDQLPEQKRQYLMQYDIEWYRAIIQFAYGQGLQNLIQKKQGYDINKYIDLLKKIQTDLKDGQINVIKQKLLKRFTQLKLKQMEDENNTTKNFILIIETPKHLEFKEITTEYTQIQTESLSIKIICYLNEFSKMETKSTDSLDIYTQQQWSDLYILVNQDNLPIQNFIQLNKNSLLISVKNSDTHIQFKAQDQQIKRILKIQDEVQFGRLYYLIKK